MTPHLERVKELAKLAIKFNPIARIYAPDEAVYIDWKNPYSGDIEEIAMMMWPTHPPEKTEEVEQTYENIAELWQAANPQFLLSLISHVEELERVVGVMEEALKRYAEIEKNDPVIRNPKCKTAIQAITIGGPAIWLYPATEAILSLSEFRKNGGMR